LIKQTLKKVLFIPDVHIPYHNKRAFNLMLKVATDFKPDITVVLGDFGDFYSVSRFTKDPSRKNNLKWEIQEVNKELDKLDKLNSSLKIFVEGNHEFRLNRYINEKVPELDGMLNVQQAFKLKERSWVHIPYRQDYKLGKVYLTHDVNQAGRYSIFRVLDTYMHSVITGHTHRLSYIVESDGVGNPILSATFGWLGDVSKIDYVHRITAVKNYVLGFGIGYVDPTTGVLYATPIPIIRNKCVLNGKIYQN